MPNGSGSQVLRFGEMALKLRLLTVEKVEEGLKLQEASRKAGLNRSIGAVLHDRGYLDLVQAQIVMESLGYSRERTRLIPDIDLKELIGRGASGAVYRGRSDKLGEDVAVKVRAPKVKSDDPDGTRFRREADFAKRLNHPNIVRLFDAGETRDFVYHVLEYVDGTPLDAALRKAGGPLDPDLVVEVGLQTASALECAEQEQIVHRDIKPANIILGKSGRVKLCDLGLAKDLQSSAQLTAGGMLLGSPFYISPEYAREGQLDTRSDIYGLGVTLFHCATGKVPFPGNTALEILEKVVRAPTPDPQTIHPGLDRNLRNAILRMIARDPEARYQTPAATVEAFQALKRGEPLPDPRPSVGLWRRFWQRLFGKKR